MSVVVPAYREEENIEATLRGIAEALREADLRGEIIVVVDIVPGDTTGSRVREISEAYPEIQVIERLGKRGVGDAVATGIKGSSGKTIIIAMGDQSERPSDVVRLARTAENCDIVFTHRFAHGKPAGYPVIKYIANRCCNYAAKLVFGIPYSDTTNAFKAYKKEILNQLDLSSKGFEIFFEMPVKAMRLARKTNEIGVTHDVREKKAPKFSVIRDGYKYVALFLSLFEKQDRKGKAF